MSIIITLLSGVFFLIGSLIALKGAKKKHLVDFSLGMAFSVMIILLTFDIVPETRELLSGKNHLFMYLFIIVGILMLKFIDLLIPHHNHEAEIKHHERHLEHIGIISTLALLIHNIIEAMGIFSLTQIDLRAGFLMMIGVGLHNVPFGIEITATLNETKKNKKEVLLNILILVLSPIISIILILLFKEISDLTVGILMSLTIGMILYLVIFELLGEILSIKNKKFLRLGLVFGILLMTFVVMLGE